MRWIITTSLAIGLSLSAQYLVASKWSVDDQFIGGYLSACVVFNFLLKVGR